jgi:hypothetical protein
MNTYDQCVLNQDAVMAEILTAVAALQGTATSTAPLIYERLKMTMAHPPSYEATLLCIGMLHAGRDLVFLDPKQRAQPVDIVWKVTA